MNTRGRNSAPALATPPAPVPAPAGPAATSAPYPPYGSMHKKLRKGIHDYPVPVGYAAPPGVDLQTAWDTKYNALLTRVTNTLWPRWNMVPGATGWVGAATSGMQALTDADFKLLPKLMSLIDKSVEQRAAGAGALATATWHAEYFRREDGAGEPWPVTEYLTADDRERLAQAATKAAVAPFTTRVGVLKLAHCTAPTLPMKDAIQRPRPYQIASLRGLTFEYLHGPGAVTSALPSGHAIQGMMSVCGALMEVWATLKPTPELLARLRQYAVDVGDRRVMAGVHYPSDNLSSWCLALSLCDELYGANAKAGRSFLVEAIRQHSAVFHALVQSKESAYTLGLAWFDELAAA